MTNSQHSDMHRDHQYWLSDAAMWRDDVALWKDEYRKALADLDKVEAALRWLVETMENHEKGIGRHVDKISTHEHAVSEFEKGGKGDTVDMLTLAKAHKDESADHTQQREAHERLKRAHHFAMAHWHTLLAELTKAAK
jgi:hypothetical protein